MTVPPFPTTKVAKEEAIAELADQKKVKFHKIHQAIETLIIKALKKIAKEKAEDKVPDTVDVDVQDAQPEFVQMIVVQLGARGWIVTHDTDANTLTLAWKDPT